MITTILLFSLVVTVAGLIALQRAVKNAKPGYEDETGFHFESAEPQTVVIEKRSRAKVRLNRGLKHAV
jgi:hypothetical protein